MNDQSFDRWLARGDGLAFLLVTGIALLSTTAGWRPNATTVLALLTVGVVLFGLPHGALDVVVSRKLAGARLRPVLVILLAYAGCAVLFALFWRFAPPWGLVIFLGISAAHFSTDWEERGILLTRLAYGLAIVTLPAVLHREQVRAIYLALGNATPGALLDASRWLAPVAAMVALLAAGRQWRLRRRDLLETLAILAAGLWLTPLLFFACYFCLLHSPRHLFATAREQGLRNGAAIVRSVAPATIATMLAGGLLFRSMPAVSAQGNLLQVVFIGLAALTVPHMLLPRAGKLLSAALR